MEATQRQPLFKVIVSVLFGVMSFLVNFRSFVYSYDEFTTVLPFGLILPLLISLSWGWKYGLLSALAGGCQTMWFLWGPSNGYAVFFIVPPYTLWVLWHGFLAENRARAPEGKKNRNLFTMELLFRLLATLNLLTLARWAITWNPPAWEWAAASATTASWSFSIFVIIKQAVMGFVLLLLATNLLMVNQIRQFFGLDTDDHNRYSSRVIGGALLIAFGFWILDSLYLYGGADNTRSFLALLGGDIPSYSLYLRISVLAVCLLISRFTNWILYVQSQVEQELIDTREKGVEKEAFLESLIQALPDLFWLKDARGRYTAVNARVGELFGMAMDEVLGKTDSEITSGEIARYFTAMDAEVISSGKTQVSEYRHIFRSDGHSEYLQTIKTPMFNASGELTGVLGISRNFSDQFQYREQLRLLTRRLETLREKERARLARDLHDELGQTLTAINMDASACLQSGGISNEADRERLKSIMTLTRSGIRELQEVCTDLRPGVLDDLGLVTAMECHLSDCEKRSGLVTHFKSRLDDDYHNPETELILYRLLQELTTNVVRHAEATELSVRLNQTGKCLHLEVCDNGKGIEQKDIDNPKSLGLLGMRERIAPYNGRMEISGQAGKGTKAVIIMNCPELPSETDTLDTGRTETNEFRAEMHTGA